MELQKVKHLHLEEAKKKPNTNHKYIITEKIDGWYVYCDFDKYEGWGNIMSSRDRVIPSMAYCLEKYFKHLPNLQNNCRLIMEAYIPDTCFYELNGIFNRSVGDYEASDVHFKIHDIIYLDSPTKQAISRYEHLFKLEEDGFFITDRLDVLSILSITQEKEEWLRIFDTITYQGGEGIILKQSDGVYCPGKRNSSLMKIKLEKELDLLCIGVYETFGEKGNRNLNIKLVNKQGVEINTRVGKHEDIDKIDIDNNYIVGKVCIVECMKVNKDGSLREPRFRAINHNKSKEDID